MKKLFSGLLFIGLLFAVGNAFGYEPDVSPIEKSCLSIGDVNHNTIDVTVYSVTAYEFESVFVIKDDPNSLTSNEFAILPEMYLGHKTYHKYRHINYWLLHKNLIDKPGTLNHFDLARGKISCSC